MSPAGLPRTARDVFKLSLEQRLLYNGLIAFCEASGVWRYPIRASGDLETMTWLDKVYWLYKTTSPITKPLRRSGLEAYFRAQEAFQWQLPDGFLPRRRVSVSAVGDLMNHPYLPNSADTLYREVDDLIFGADLSMANLECVVYPKGTGQLSFSPKNGPPLYYDLESFDVAKGFQGRQYAFMATAGNHSLDFGAEGVASTIATLKANGIDFNGVNEKDEDADSATIIERSGIRIGLISHTFGLNAHRPPQGRPRIVNRTDLNGTLGRIDLGQIERQIRSCREREADLTIAQFHWGMEHELYPRPEQVELAHQLAELGIDVIIGHHPHVVQPVEWYRTQRDPNRVVPIYYSLGNLINPFSAPYLCLSYVAQMGLAKGTLPDGTERTYVERAGRAELIQDIDEERRTARLLVRSSTP